MPVTDQEARALAFLAAAVRERLRLPRWNPAGIEAAIKRVADRDLADVCDAVIRASRDPRAQTPGVIPTAGPHWISPQSEERAERDRTPVAELCGVCLNPEPKCRRIWGNDHAFERNARSERPAVDVAATIRGLRGLKAGD